MKVVTSFSHLMKLASILGKAKQSGDLEAIEKARKAHDEYKQICLQPGVEMSLGCTVGHLASTGKPRD